MTETQGLQGREKGIMQEKKLTEKMNKELSKITEITNAELKGVAHWSNYNGQDPE